MRLRTGNDKEDHTDVPLAKLLRRVQARGIAVDPFEDDGIQLSRGLVIEIFFFEDPVSEAEIRRIAELFDLDPLVLYFDKVEKDFQ